MEEEKFSHGGCSQIYIVYEKEIIQNDEHLVKTIKKQYKQNKHQEQYLQNENNILIHLENCTDKKEYFPICYGTDIKTCCLFIEFFDGEELVYLLNNYSSIEKTEKIQIFNELIDAFMTLNENNVIHRDIKPDNILYNIVKKDKINIKIIDFNESILIGNTQDNLLNGMTYGTIMYRCHIKFLSQQDSMKQAKKLLQLLKICNYPNIRYYEINQDYNYYQELIKNMDEYFEDIYSLSLILLMMNNYSVIEQTEFELQKLKEYIKQRNIKTEDEKIKDEYNISYEQYIILSQILNKHFIKKQINKKGNLISSYEEIKLLYSIISMSVLKEKTNSIELYNNLIIMND